MEPAPRPQLDELFQQALDLPLESERLAFVARVQAEDRALGERLASLLEAHDRAEPFLAEPAIARPKEPQQGDVLGPYRLERRLGEGGFGVVWSARHMGEPGTPVALKLLKAGMDSAQVLARFAAERSALARLDHPGIARVIDAGSSANGRPYLCMELVEGPPLIEHADAAKLGIEERLRIFLLVCDAVQHAHQKGVLHRDIKPGNVLVAAGAQGAATPKVIDFGVAKAMVGRLGERTLETGRGQLLGTPVYMSPEQAAGHHDVDTRSDVYALGVLLYELLAGAPPFSEQQLLAEGPAELQRILENVDPPRPSQAWQRHGVRQRKRMAALRSAGPYEVGARLRGDLDWIVGRALEKDRSRRYPTAHALARDVERHLASLPIEAGAPGPWQRLTKFTRRNPALAAGLAVLIPSLGAGVSLAVIGLRQAEEEAAHNAEVSEFLQTHFAPEGEAAKLPPDLDLVLAESLSLFGPSHAATGAVLREGAERLTRLGDPAGAEPWLRAALDLATRNRDSGTALRVRAQLGLLYADLGRSALAEPELRSALDGDQEAATAPLVRADAAATLASLVAQRGDFPQAAELLGRAVQLRRAAAPSAHRRLARDLDTRAEMLSLAGQWKAAEAVWQELLREYGALFQPNSLQLARQRLGYGKWLARSGNAEQALSQLIPALAVLSRHPNEEPHQLLEGLDLGIQLLRGQPEREEQLEQWLRLHTQTGRMLWRADSVDLADSLLAEAEFLSSRGRPDEAIQPQAEAIQILRGVDGRQKEVQSRVGSLIDFVQQMALESGRAEELYSAARSSAGIFLSDVPEKSQALVALAMTSYRLGHYQRALARLKQAEDLEAGERGDLPSLHAMLALTYAKAGRRSEARRSLGRAVEWLASRPEGSDRKGEALIQEARDLLGSQ